MPSSPESVYSSLTWSQTIRRWSTRTPPSLASPPATPGPTQTPSRSAPPTPAQTTHQSASPGKQTFSTSSAPTVLFEHRSSIQHGDDAHDDTTRSAIDLRTGRALVTEVHTQNSMTPDPTMIRTLPHLWHRTGYDLLVRGDAQQDTLAFFLRDPLQRVWHIMTIQGPPRLYWLDAPPIDRKTRRALLHAFDGAAMYDETIKYVRYTPNQTNSHT